MQLLASGSTSSATSLTISGIPARKYVRLVLMAGGKSGAEQYVIQFNGDTSAKYSYRASTNGGAEATATSANYALVGINGTVNQTIIADIQNVSTAGKEGNFMTSGEVIAATSAPSRITGAFFWENNAQISSITITTTGGLATFGMIALVYGAD